MTWDCGPCGAAITGDVDDALGHCRTEHPGPNWTVEHTSSGPLIVATYPDPPAA